MSARDLLAAATERPWEIDPAFVCDIGHPGSEGSEGEWGARVAKAEDAGDAALIVAAVNEYEVHDALAEEARRMAGRARGAAEVLRGIPAFMAQWSTFDDIARNLERELARLDAVRRST